jgi:hypothetical protein
VFSFASVYYTTKSTESILFLIVFKIFGQLFDRAQQKQSSKSCVYDRRFVRLKFRDCRGRDLNLRSSGDALEEINFQGKLLDGGVVGFIGRVWFEP